MTTILHKANTVKLNGNLPGIGTQAPDFTITLANLADKKLSEVQANVKVLLCMPSLDTATCALETRTFNQKLAGLQGVEAFVITKDLPFAMKRFCETEGITNVQSASDFRYNDFATKYGVEITEGALKGLHARAVFVLDKNNTITYSELVADVSAEPNYGVVLDAIQHLL